MITRDSRYYNYFTIGKQDAYGQTIMPGKDSAPEGKIKMCVNIAGSAVQDNILYESCSYVGLTKDNINDTYIIDYNGKRLKVLYINPKGRYKQVFLEGID